MTTDLGRYPRERRQAAEQSAQKNENKIEKAHIKKPILKKPLYTVCRYFVVV
jgi:hypothetical protein